MTYRIAVRVTLYGSAPCEWETRDEVATVRAVSRRHAVSKALEAAQRDHAAGIDACERDGGTAEVEVSILEEVAA